MGLITLVDRVGNAHFHITLSYTVQIKILFIPECKATGALAKIFHRTRQPCSQYYLSEAKSVDPNNIRDVLKESTPFKYPQELEQFSFKVAQKVWHSKLIRNELRKKYYDKTNVRSRQSVDLLRRLYVESPMEGAKARTIFDLDPHFYSICEGRPIDKRFSMSNFQKVNITKL